MSDLERLKHQIIADVDARRDELIHISDTIHANPELGFEEFGGPADRDAGGERL